MVMEDTKLKLLEQFDITKNNKRYTIRIDTLQVHNGKLDKSAHWKCFKRDKHGIYVEFNNAVTDPHGMIETVLKTLEDTKLFVVNVTYVVVSEKPAENPITWSNISHDWMTKDGSIIEHTTMNGTTTKPSAKEEDRSPPHPAPHANPNPPHNQSAALPKTIKCLQHKHHPNVLTIRVKKRRRYIYHVPVAPNGRPFNIKNSTLTGVSPYRIECGGQTYNSKFCSRRMRRTLANPNEHVPLFDPQEQPTPPATAVEKQTTTTPTGAGDEEKEEKSEAKKKKEKKNGDNGENASTHHISPLPQHAHILVVKTDDGIIVPISKGGRFFNRTSTQVVSTTPLVVMAGEERKEVKRASLKDITALLCSDSPPKNLW